MNETSRLIDALKSALKNKGITYADLAKRIAMSEANVKRMFSKQTLSLQQLELICTVIEFDFFELAKLARQKSELISELSLQQERDLCKDSRLLGLWYLLANAWDLPQILKAYVLTEPEAITLLVQLDRIGVIELGVGNIVKLKTTRTVHFRLDGPVRVLYRPVVEKSFLSNRFTGTSELFRFEFRELSGSSIAVLHDKLTRLAMEINELADVDEAVGNAGRRTVGMMLGLRPWTIEDIVSIKKRASP